MFALYLVHERKNVNNKKSVDQNTRIFALDICLGEFLSKLVLGV